MMNRFCVLVLLAFLSLLCQSQNTEDRRRDAAGKEQSSKSIIESLAFPSENVKSSTGAYSLENGGKSLLAKLWLAAHTQKTIDIQIFSFEKDATGLIAADFMIRAADRGVKVRLLIDDLASRMYSREMQLFDSHDNIEVRVYNPAFAHGKIHRRVFFSAKNSLWLQYRMHNKVLIFDKTISIIGGRNIGDVYSDYDRKFNFRDRDVFLVGKTLEQINKSFEDFWNDELTIEYSKLSGDRVVRVSKEKDRFDKLHRNADGSKDFYAATRAKIKNFPLEIDSAMKRGDFVWTKNVSFISDVPGKNTGFAETDKTVCTDSLVQILRKARRSVIIQSPYFILTDETRKVLKEIIARGVKVRLLTNSMASIDSHNAFSGYRKDRREILQIGVKIYEYRPDAKIRHKLMLPDVQAGIGYKAEYGFHPKTVIVDDDVVVIGSYNFDPRSHKYNTECMAVFRSEKFASRLLKIAEEEFGSDNSWLVTLDNNPDKQAALSKRVSAFFASFIPKQFL